MTTDSKLNRPAEIPTVVTEMEIVIDWEEFVLSLIRGFPPIYPRRDPNVIDAVEVVDRTNERRIEHADKPNNPIG